MVRISKIAGALTLLFAPSNAQNLDDMQSAVQNNHTRTIEDSPTSLEQNSDASDSAEFLKQERKHPQVQGQANYVNLELRGNTDYHGPLYIGSDYTEVSVIYDTATQWVIVNNADIENQDINSNYNVEESSTAVQQMDGGQPISEALVFGTVDFEGTEYTDKMCLSQQTNNRVDTTGRLCVRNMPFTCVDKLIGTFEANGIIGLAPNSHELSYVNQLFEQGVIESKKVGLNYENPRDQNSISQISFGYYDAGQIKNGTDGLNYYSNIGLNHWAMLMDDVTYGPNEIGLGVSGKMAVIDSGNTSIQIPDTQFKELRDLMKRQDSSITIQTVDDKEILTSRKSCKDLYSVFSPLQFKLQSTQISIKPEGYLYSLGGQSDCFVGIQSIPDRFNQYRLGTIFLRNFYTGLDFDNNLIVLGINDGVDSAELIGKTSNPFKVKQGSGALVFVIVFVIIMVLVAAACYIRAKRIEKRNMVTFNHESQQDAKKQYKNGVEQVPSEIAKSKKKNAINDTMDEEDQEETLLDQE